MSTIEVNCCSTNFQQSPKWLFPLTAEQRNAAMEIFLELQPENLHETGQRCAQVGSSRLYVDSALFDEPEVLLFNFAISPEANERIASTVFRILTAAALVAELPSTKLRLSVPSTPLDRLPTDWKSEWSSGVNCQSPEQFLGLLAVEFQAHELSLSRFPPRRN